MSSWIHLPLYVDNAYTVHAVQTKQTQSLSQLAVGIFLMEAIPLRGEVGDMFH